MGGWQKIKMDDLIDEISMGPFGSDIKVSCFVERGIPVLNGSNLFGTRLKEDSFRYVTPEKADSLKKANAYRGDVIVTHRGTLGQIVYIPQNSTQPRYVISQSQFRFRCNDKVIPEYVVNYFHSHEGQNKILANASQVGVPALARASSSFRDIEIPVPPLPTQRKIAAVLGALDDKIENNRKICANLEAQAQAIFKSWFVDFEPFGGKQLTDVIWGNHPEELRYVKVGNLNPILETGSRPKGGAALSGIPSIGAENVKQLGEFDFGAKKFIPEEYAAKLKRGKINGYELLLYKDGGKPGMFKPHFSMFGEGFPYEECYINEHVFKVDFGNRATNIFAYFYFKSQYVFNWLEMNGGKAAIPGINQSNVLDVMMPDPTHKLVQEFGESVEPLFKMIFNLCKESRALAATRDALLPKLMSGEIDVEKVKVA